MRGDVPQISLMSSWVCAWSITAKTLALYKNHIWRLYRHAPTYAVSDLRIFYHHHHHHHLCKNISSQCMLTLCVYDKE
jgi:hypothetical protein